MLHCHRFNSLTAALPQKARHWICIPQKTQRLTHLQSKTSSWKIRSQHCFLHSEYKPLVQRQPLKRRTVRKWSQEAKEAPRGCFNVTDWIALCNQYEEDIYALTDCVWLTISTSEWTTLFPLEQSDTFLIANLGWPMIWMNCRPK